MAKVSPRAFGRMGEDNAFMRAQLHERIISDGKLCFLQSHLAAIGCVVNSVILFFPSVQV
jgi:hypothetical protein